MYSDLQHLCNNSGSHNVINQSNCRTVCMNSVHWLAHTAYMLNRCCKEATIAVMNPIWRSHPPIATCRASVTRLWYTVPCIIHRPLCTLRIWGIMHVMYSLVTFFFFFCFFLPQFKEYWNTDKGSNLYRIQLLGNEANRRCWYSYCE